MKIIWFVMITTKIMKQNWNPDAYQENYQKYTNPCENTGNHKNHINRKDNQSTNETNENPQEKYENP